jgi:diaminohydroxyphosphoribosylaminopyrimidine deaminase/5-amino-6-(5-phosphoribosylamino)uracil reductase
MRWRARSDALLTGSGTVLADDPQLTVRFDDDTPFVPPLRVVLDPGLATVARGRIREGAAPTLYVHAPDAKPPRALAAERIAVAASHAGELDLEAVLRVLAARGVGEVQLEAGATLSGAFLRAGLVDELLLYVAPVLLGDLSRPLFGGLGISDMAQRLQLRIVESLRVGDDLRVLLRADAPAVADPGVAAVAVVPGA